MSKKNKNKHPKGRPEISDVVVGKILDALSWGCSITDACNFAQINRDTYYEYCRRHPDFSDKCEYLRNQTSIHARMTIANAIKNGDIATAKWYLERKHKDEFSTKQTLDSNINGGFQFVTEAGDENI